MTEKQMTEKQKKFQKLIMDNLGNKKSRSNYSMLIEAGYSKASAKQQTDAFKSAKNAGGSVVEVMEELRRKALNFTSDEKLNDSTAKDLTDITDKLTKNIQLLTGGETERHKIVVLPADAINKYGATPSPETNS